MKEKLEPIDPELVADGLNLLRKGSADYYVFGEEKTLHVVERIDSLLDAAGFALIRAGVDLSTMPVRTGLRLADAMDRRIKKIDSRTVDLTE